MNGELTTILLRVPRDLDITPESAKTFLASLSGINSPTLMQKLSGNKPQVLSLEIIARNQQIVFAITTSNELAPFVEGQLQSNYPLAVIERGQDPLQGHALEVVDMTLRNGPLY